MRSLIVLAALPLLIVLMGQTVSAGTTTANPATTPPAPATTVATTAAPVTTAATTAPPVTANVDECIDPLLNTCDMATAGTACIDDPASFTCGCVAGYIGGGTVASPCVLDDSCILGADDCSAVGGICTSLGAGAFSCSCEAGFTGAGTPASPCVDIVNCGVDDNCNPGGDGSPVCAETPGGFECNCAAGWVGGGTVASPCVDENECTAGTHTCVEAGATCTNLPGGAGFTCACPNDNHWSGTYQSGNDCVDRDECALITAALGATAACDVATTSGCEGIPPEAPSGSYSCTCNPGFEGEGYGGAAVFAPFAPYPGAVSSACTDIVNCGIDDDCGVHSVCTDGLGSFTCACEAGYDGSVNGTDCQDVDECATNNGNCDANASCSNTDGSRTCTCNPGFVGDGETCVDVNECSTGHGGCSDFATCTNTPGAFSCNCNSGYSGTGTVCNDIDECAGANDCDVGVTGALCNNLGGLYTCSCDGPGYTGNGYTVASGGTSCTSIDECAIVPSVCVAGVTCVETDALFSCPCPIGYFGDGLESTSGTPGGGCELELECTTGTDTCDDNALCTETNVPTPSSFSCACNTGFIGSGGAGTCVNIDECATNNGGCNVVTEVCTDLIGSSECSCAPGFSDVLGVCTDDTECVSGHNCDLVLGVCAETPGSFTCGCAPGYINDGLGSNTCVDILECSIPATNNCDNIGGVCHEEAGSYSCSCAPGFIVNATHPGPVGTSCVSINECIDPLLNTCATESICVDTVGSFSCLCLPGYSPELGGTVCNNDDECALGSHDCDPTPGAATCTDTLGSFTCDCEAPFAGLGSACTKPNCATHPDVCHPLATCSNNTLAGLECTCQAPLTTIDLYDCSPTGVVGQPAVAITMDFEEVLSNAAGTVTVGSGDAIVVFTIAPGVPITAPMTIVSVGTQVSPANLVLDLGNSVIDAATALNLFHFSGFFGTVVIRNAVDVVGFNLITNSPGTVIEDLSFVGVSMTLSGGQEFPARKISFVLCHIEGPSFSQGTVPPPYVPTTPATTAQTIAPTTAAAPTTATQPPATTVAPPPTTQPAPPPTTT